MAERPVYLLSPLSKEGTLSLPMISFAQVAESIDFGSCDTLMFTSKQAVVTADRIDPKWREIPSIAIGPATKKQIESLGGKVIFHPENFYGHKLAEDIARFFGERHILYLRPREVSFDSREYLASRGIQLREQILYETNCVEYPDSERPPEYAIIIFTSPSTIRCFLKNFKWLESYTAVVIGESTREHLPANCKYAVSDRPLISACIEKAISLQ